ncbi:unnamed protein product, partial [Dibothriocephalus latus]
MSQLARFEKHTEETPLKKWTLPTFLNAEEEENSDYFEEEVSHEYHKLERLMTEVKQWESQYADRRTYHSHGEYHSSSEDLSTSSFSENSQLDKRHSEYRYGLKSLESHRGLTMRSNYLRGPVRIRQPEFSSTGSTDIYVTGKSTTSETEQPWVARHQIYVGPTTEGPVNILARDYEGKHDEFFDTVSSGITLNRRMCLERNLMKREQRDQNPNFRSRQLLRVSPSPKRRLETITMNYIEVTAARSQHERNAPVEGNKVEECTQVDIETIPLDMTDILHIRQHDAQWEKGEEGTVKLNQTSQKQPKDTDKESPAVKQTMEIMTVQASPNTDTDEMMHKATQITTEKTIKMPLYQPQITVPTHSTATMTSMAFESMPAAIVPRALAKQQHTAPPVSQDQGPVTSRQEKSTTTAIVKGLHETTTQADHTALWPAENIVKPETVEQQHTAPKASPTPPTATQKITFKLAASQIVKPVLHDHAAAIMCEVPKLAADISTAISSKFTPAEAKPTLVDTVTIPSSDFLTTKPQIPVEQAGA